MTNDYLNKIICGNCVEVLSNIDDSSIDMCLTSPPYDNLRNYDGGYDIPFKKIVEELIEELYRVIKDGGVVVWVVNDATINGSETCTSFRQALSFVQYGFNLHDTMIFKKKNPVPQFFNKRYTNEFEYMFIFSKGAPSVCNALKVECKCKDRNLYNTTYKTFSRNVQIRSKRANPVKGEKIRGNIWEYTIGQEVEAKEHPAPFPYELARDHILSWSNQNNIILDPMCGSGTSCVASIDLNRRFIGIDIAKKYCKLAQQRVKDHFLKNNQLDLFELPQH